MGCGASASRSAEAPLTPEEADALKQNLRDVLYQFKIKIADADDVMVLRQYEIVIIADDSGSMGHTTEAGITRWQELKDTVSLVVDMGCCFDKSGVDVYFLNRLSVMGVKSSKDAAFVSAFQKGPGGTTPLTETLQKVLSNCSGGKPELLIILTDGVPNGGVAQFEAALARAVKRTDTKIQIIACTSDDSAVGYLNDIDAKFTEIDVTDDYHSEKKEVEAAGKMKSFSRGDWCMKALLGPVSSKFDGWDEAEVWS